MSKKRIEELKKELKALIQKHAMETQTLYVAGDNILADIEHNNYNSDLKELVENFYFATHDLPSIYKLQVKKVPMTKTELKQLKTYLKANDDD